MPAIRMPSTIVAVGLAVALVVAAADADEPAGAASTLTVSRTAHGLTLEARDVPLREVLERIAALEKLDLEIRGTIDPRVTATIRDASLAETLQRLVRYDFVLGVGRLIVYLGDSGQRSRTGETVDGGQPQRGGFRLPSRRPPADAEPDPDVGAEPEPDE
jgi:hypothetical protein